MAAMYSENNKNWAVVALRELPDDLRRMINIQIRELIHEIEDCEDHIPGSTRAEVVLIFEQLFRAA